MLFSIYLLLNHSQITTSRSNLHIYFFLPIPYSLSTPPQLQQYVDVDRNLRFRSLQI